MPRGGQRRRPAVSYKLPRTPRPPKIEAPRPIFTRGPKALQRALQARPTGPWRQVPDSWRGAETEYAIWWALTVPLKKVPEQDFSYQEPFQGGRQQLGGMVVDFLMLDGSGIAMNPVGRYYHLELGSAKLAIDQSQKAYLLGFGVELIFIDERLALDNPVYAVEQALRGIDMSEIGPGAR